MKKSIKNNIIRCLVIIFFLPLVSVAQEDGIDSMSVKRQQWFYYQRSYPNDTIPRNAYSDAIEHSIDLKNSDSYYLGTSGSWTSIGPKPIYLSINGWDYSTGRVSMIKFDPNNSSNIFLAASGGGIWKSTNAGYNWVAKPNNYSSSSGCIAIDGVNNIIYYGTGEMHYFVYSYYGNGILKSTDGGETWSHITNGLPMTPSYFSKIVIRPGHENELLAACGTNYTNISNQSGLYRSTDYGESWTKIVPTSGNLVCFDVAFSPDGSKAYIVGPNITSTLVYERGVQYRKSTNGGITFGEPLTDVLDPDGASHISVCKNDGYIYVITNCGEFCNKLYKSTDEGDSFSLIHNFNGSWDYQGWYNLLVAVSPYNSNIVFCGTNDLYRSTDGGSNFTDVAGYTTPYVHADMQYLDFSTNTSEQSTVILGCDGGVWKSTNLGSNWINLNSTLEISNIYRIGANTFNPDIIVAGVQDMGMGHRTDNGVQWYDYSRGGDGGNFTFSKTMINMGVGVECPYGAILYTTNSGSSLNNTSIPGIWDNQNDWLAPVVSHPRQEGVFYTARRISSITRVWKSTDNGVNWNRMGNDIPVSGPPQNIAISTSNPGTMYISLGSYVWPSMTSQIYKTTNEGVNWSSNLFSDLPNRYVSHLAVDPKNPNTVYATLSGFGTGHVFRTSNGGGNWTDISGTRAQGGDHMWVPNTPVNDLEIKYISAIQKQLLIATDVGVLVGYDPPLTQYIDPYHWNMVAEGLPTCVVMDLDYNRTSGLLRAATFGRGVWETNINPEQTLYAGGYLELNSDENGLAVYGDIVVAENDVLHISNSCTIKMGSGKKIIVEEGGEIDISSGAAVTFTSQSGTWGGIELNGDCSAIIKNCTFANTSTPIVIEGNPLGAANPPDIIIDSCNFNAPIEITNRKDVIVEYCNFNYSSGSAPSVLGIFSSGSDNALFSNNIINSSSSISSIGISVVYGSGIIIQKNEINNMSVGISISNSSPFVSQNRITNGTPSSAIVGIGFDNSYSASVKQNSVIGFQIGYKMYNSSPEMYMDSSFNTNTSGDSVNGVHAVYLSSPRLRPTESIGGIIWDAGKNNLKNMYKGNGIYMYMLSAPILDYGYNYIWGYDNYLFGDGPDAPEYYVRCNNWVDNPPNSSEFNLTNPSSTVYSPYGCTPPGGSGYSSDKDPKEMKNDISESDGSDNPPANIILSYGHGIYDTIKVTSGTNESTTADHILYGQGVKEELLGNYESAILKFKTLIENYQDSSISINAMKKILNCYEKMNADSSAYTNLRSYYLTLAQNNLSDSSFVKAAKEFATKTLVRKGEYGSAITEYENTISGNYDAHEVLCCELNIIETYLIMSEQGDAPSFTGRLASLKPLSRRDGYQKLLEKLYGIKSTQSELVIPEKFSLSQNYPNPFNPVTRINYSVPRTSKVTMTVYDILGRSVKTLVSDFKEAGHYTVTFDGSGLASGVYFYRIEAGDFVDSKKMVLVK